MALEFGSALSGAASGAAFGPWGAAVGGLVGLGASLFGADTELQKYAEYQASTGKGMFDYDWNSAGAGFCSFG